MRIFCLTPWFPVHPHDQHGSYILDSIESLIDLGHEVIVLVSQPWRPKGSGLIQKNWAKVDIDIQKFSKKFDLSVCKHISIPRNYFRNLSNWFYRTKLIPEIKKLACNYRCDIILAHTELAGMAAVEAGKLIGIPTVITLHGIDTDKKLYVKSVRKKLYEYPLQNANRVVLVGQPLLPFFREFVDKTDHFRIVPNGFRFSTQHSTQPVINFTKTQINFISVSNLVEGKGIEINLQALANLKKAGINQWHYRIVGDGDQFARLQKIAEYLNLVDQVTFLGQCDHNKVYSYLQESDVFILPSYREAFGIAYIEAMSLGLLTVGVLGQGPQTFIKNGVSGFLIPPKNDLALTEILKFIFESPSKAADIAASGQRHVLEHFTWQNHAKKLETVFKELI